MRSHDIVISSTDSLLPGLLALDELVGDCEFGGVSLAG
jgi:hypothetical protein